LFKLNRKNLFLGPFYVVNLSRSVLVLCSFSIRILFSSAEVLVFLIWFLTPTAEFRARTKVLHLFVSCLRVLVTALLLILSAALDQEWLSSISTVPVSAKGLVLLQLRCCQLCLLPWFLGAVFLPSAGPDVL
jgi:hypothetical protein